MNLVVIRRYLRDRRVTLVVYCIAALAFALMYTSLFPSLKSQMVSYDEILKSFPKGMLEAMGIQQLNMHNFESYFSAEYLSLIWPILAIIFAISQAGRSLAGGVESGSIGLELTQPVSRTQTYISKYLGGVISLTIFTVVTILGVIPIAAIFNADVVVSHWLMLCAMSWLFVISIFSVAYAISAMFSDRAKVYGLIAGLMLLMYVVRVIAGLQEKLDWLRLTSFFYYYDGPGILAKGNVMSNGIGLFVAVIVISTLLGAWWWNRRDISV